MSKIFVVGKCRECPYHEVAFLVGPFSPQSPICTKMMAHFDYKNEFPEWCPLQENTNGKTEIKSAEGKEPGQAEYEASVEKVPFYHTKERRRSWVDLPDFIKRNWASGLDNAR